MNLPFLKKQQPEKSFFLSLLIKPNKVGAILFEEVNDKLFILSTNEATLDSEAEDISTETLLAASDRAISFVEGSLPEGGSVNKTIFSLPYDFIVEGKIKPEYLDRLKTICKSLELTPIGYLTAIEAIVHFIEKSEGAPVSAIFIEVTKGSVFAYLVRAGKIIETHASPLEGSVIETTESLLKKMESVDSLPAKIILLDYDDAQSLQQEFLSYKWPKAIPFLHVPQVVVLEKGFENEATINGVATQMELEVLSDIKMQEEPIEPEDVLEQATSAEFGFIKEKDIAEIQKTEVEKPPSAEASRSEQKADAISEESNIEPASLASFSKVPGVKPNDIDESADTKIMAGEPDVKYFKEDDVDNSHENYDQVDEVAGNSKFSLPINLAGILGSLKNLKIPSIPKMPSFGGGGAAKTKLIIGLIGIVVLIIAASFVYYNFLIHAHVIIFADKKAIDKSADVTFSKNPTGDNAIKLDIISEEVNGDDTVNSTGQKQTGDKAHGSVTIYNKTDNSKTFSKGTIVVGPNNLEFDLTDDIQIASTSSFSTTLSSSAVKVEASNFGKEYNLPSASNFTVKGFSSSDFIAKNSDAISGGTSKTTTVVAQKDLDGLLAGITDKLSKDAMSKANSGLASSQVIFPQALASDISDKSYTKKVGDESGSVGISATIKFDIGEYQKDDVQKVVQNLSKDEVPVSYVLQEGSSKVDINNIKINSTDESATATLKANAVYSPEIDIAKEAAQLSGKTESAANTQIRKIVGVTDVNISFSNSLPFLPHLLPFNSRNIEIEVKN